MSTNLMLRGIIRLCLLKMHQGIPVWCFLMTMLPKTMANYAAAGKKGGSSILLKAWCCRASWACVYWSNFLQKQTFKMPCSIMQQTMAHYAAVGKKGGSSILLKAWCCRRIMSMRLLIKFAPKADIQNAPKHHATNKGQLCSCRQEGWQQHSA